MFVNCPQLLLFSSVLICIYDLYSYKTNISMRITILASRGTDARNLVAVDTIIVKMDNATTSSSISLAEPEADIEDEV